jgi:tetratricopeptide (TPR) repeat protein
MPLKGYSEFEWEIKDAKSGDKTLLLGGRAVYSTYNPVEQTDKSAHKLIADAREEYCDHVIIIGLGLGYLPRSLYNAGFKRIIVWDPFPVMQGSFPLCSGDWRRTVAVVHEYNEFEKAALRFAGKSSKPKLIIHPGYDIFCRLEHRLAVQTLERIYNTRNDESCVISQRSLESLVRLPFLGTIREVKGIYKGRRAVLANPGPSLKKCVQILKRADDTIVFASLQSAAYLQKNGIKINYIVCADPKDMSPFTAECNDDFDVFFAETSIDPGTLDWKQEKTMVFHFKCGQVHEKLWEQSQLPVIENPTSSVSEVMLLLADYMGFDEMYCLGMDFCWKEDRYTYRTKYKHDDDVRINDMASCFKLSASDSQIVTTQSLYYHGARFMQLKCSELNSKGKDVYQVEGGLEFASSGVLTVDELEKKLHSGKDGLTVNIANRQSPITVEQVEHLLNEIKLGRIKGRQTQDENGKIWPFLQAIPDEEIPGACDRAINKMRSAHIMSLEPQPRDADTLLHIGLSHLQYEELNDAEAAMRKVIKLKPGEALAYSTLGNVLKRLERFEEAIACHERAVYLMPLSAEARSNLASAYLSWGNIDLAVEEYRMAVGLHPDLAELHYNLGTALQKGEQYEDACTCFRHVLKLKPDHVHAMMNLGTSLKALGRLDEAITWLRCTAEFAPDFADAHWNLALTLLLSGDYLNGWKEYEWRLEIPDIPVRKFHQPVWDGSVRTEKTLLLHAEQGMGDVIHFVRYTALARKRVGRVILDCHEPLVRLLSDIKGVDQIVSTGKLLPLFDIHLPLLSLPRVLGATPDNVPNDMPYLKADSVLIDKWRAKISTGKYRVGIVRAGNPRHDDDHNRSIKPSTFARLLKMPDVSFYSLQKESPDSQSIVALEGINVIDTGPELTDFADTAALIANLDLIISVDTAVAHLAGAMGKPVWLLLPFAPDWRWMLYRDDTPWYPTMRIFRQSRPGDWDGVLVDIARALKTLLSSCCKKES